MSTLAASLDEYLRVRRALGFGLVWTEGYLRRFVDFMRRRRRSMVTTKLAVEWAKLPQNVAPSHWGERLVVVRAFARFLQSKDSRHEVPPDRLLPARRRRKRPHIFTRQEIDALVRTALTLRSPVGLRARTMATLIGLLATTGMRHGEALKLERIDADLAAGVLTIRETKFNKTRLVPLHRTTTEALVEYAEARDRLVQPASGCFFVKEDGRPYGRHGTRLIFLQLCDALGIRTRAARPFPRLHDLRHTFAVNTVMDWYRRGRDVDKEIVALSTYLGHGSPEDTYWYLSSVPELMALAGRRAERIATGGAA